MKQLVPFLGFGDRGIHLLGHPYALARSALRHSITLLASELPSGPMLDVGCGTMPYRDLFRLASIYEGLEIDQLRQTGNHRVTYFYDGVTFPIADNHFASILCSEVLEHSFNPERLLSECHRVLRPGGALLLTVPFLWPEHEQPWDSQRFTRFGLQQRLESAGFSIHTMIKLNVGLPALLQLLIDWVEAYGRRILGQVPDGLARKVFLLAWRLFWVLPYTAINLLGSMSRYLCSLTAGSLSRRPKHLSCFSAELYLSNVVLAVKPHQQL